MAYTIRFKSTPENFRKEFLNLKRNTVRFFDNPEDERKEVCDRWIAGEIHDVICEIEVTEGYGMFSNKVTDITEWKGQYIISW